MSSPQLEKYANIFQGFRRNTHEHVSAVEPLIAQNAGSHLPESCAPQTRRGRGGKARNDSEEPVKRWCFEWTTNPVHGETLVVSRKPPTPNPESSMMELFSHPGG